MSFVAVAAANGSLDICMALLRLQSLRSRDKPVDLRRVAERMNLNIVFVCGASWCAGFFRHYQRKYGFIPSWNCHLCSCNCNNLVLMWTTKCHEIFAVSFHCGAQNKNLIHHFQTPSRTGCFHGLIRRMMKNNVSATSLPVTISGPQMQKQF